MCDQQQIHFRVNKIYILSPENKSYKTGHSTNKHMKKGGENTEIIKTINNAVHISTISVERLIYLL